MHETPFFSETTTTAKISVCHGRTRAGFTVVELLVALGVFGLVMTMATRQLIEGVKLNMKTAQTLEFEGSSRRLIDQLNIDVSSAAVVTIFPGFDDRSSTVGDGSFGNYVVLQQIDASGTITRTIGYYLGASDANGARALHRHDSADGVLVPGVLPDATTVGTHRRLVSTVRLPEATGLFRSWRGRGFTVRGQFGTPQGAPTATARLEYVQCSLTTRS